MRPVIAISQRRDLTGPPHNEMRDTLDTRLAAFVLQTGALPVPVPSALDPTAIPTWCAALKVTGIVISGGGDPGYDAVRDGVETALMDYARARSLPLLGICRGMQMMGTVAGMECIVVPDHVATRHRLRGSIKREVNSYHEYALRGCPKEYHPLAIAADDVLEAMRHNDLPWEGWMWHPEREADFAPADITRFKELFGCAP